MSSRNDPLAALRQALELSPDNLPLRMHLAESLLAQGQAEQAAAEYKEALARHPDDIELKIGLARASYQLGNDSVALVIVEDLLKGDRLSAEGYLLHARLLLRGGHVERAVLQYREGIRLDPEVADTELAGRLGIDARIEDAAEVVEGRLRQSSVGDGSERPAEIAQQNTERPKITFADVGGMEALKEEIRLKIIYPLQHPEMYRAYGKPIGGGILMYGPPGCGKTHLARATAGEISADFLAVGIDDVLEMWIGNSERNMHQLFEHARRNTPFVLFFDEVDALGARRSDMQHSASRHLINQFLAELDGVDSNNDGVLVLAATNAPWHVDPGFRRPGRFDRVLFVPPPDATAREEILRLLCRNKPVSDIDFRHVAKKTDGFSGADLKAVVDVAVERKLAEAMKAGGLKPLGTRDLVDAARKLKPTCQEWFATARNYALYSNQGGTYDDILEYLGLKK